jgi:hypothetical protein
MIKKLRLSAIAPAAKSALRATIGTALLCVGAMAAHAAPVTYSLTGNVTEVTAGLGSGFSVGQTASFTFTYETSTANNIGPTYGNYNGPLTAYSGTIGGWAFSWAASNGSTINIPQNYGMDMIMYGPTWNASQVNGLSPNYSNIFIYDPDGTTPGGFFDNVGLPTTLPTAGGFFYMPFGDFSNRQWVYGSIPSITSPAPQQGNSVPEPGTLVLTLAAGMGLLALRKKAQRAA